MIIHLGKNPKKGGSPPSERRGKKNNVLIKFLKFKKEKI